MDSQLHDFGFSEVPETIMLQIPKVWLKTGCVVEHPVGVTLGGGFWSEGHPKIDWRVFLHFIVKALKYTILKLSRGLYHYITVKGPKGILNGDLKWLLKNFISNHAKFFFSPGSNSWTLQRSMFQLNHYMHSQLETAWGSVAWLFRLQRIHSHATHLGVHDNILVTEQSHHPNFGHPTTIARWLRIVQWIAAAKGTASISRSDACWWTVFDWYDGPNLLCWPNQDIPKRRTNVLDKTCLA